MIVAWVLFPAVMLVLAAGWGSIVARLSGGAVPPALLLPVGFAAIVVVSGLATILTATVRLATPVVVGGAVAGIALAWPFGRPPRAALWPLAAGVLVFAAYAAPIVLSGQATYAGYLTLDDTATLFAMTDRMLDAGRTIHGLAPSTYQATLATSLMVGYPMGSLLPLGIGARLVGDDLAWVFQPYLALVVALLALVLWQLLATAIPRRSWRLVAVVLAAQPALLYGYGTWVGVKELSAALLVALAASLAHARRDDPSVRSWLPLATVAGATLGVLSLGGVVWLVPLALWLATVGRSGARLRGLAGAAAVAVVVALPAIAQAGPFLGDGHIGSWSSGRLANLIRPLNPLQLFGVWPAGDFRVRPDRFWPTVVIVVIVAALAAAGLARSLRARDALLAYAGCALLGALVYSLVGSPWIEAKALATASPAVLALAASGCAWLARSGRRTEATVAAALVAGGILWSNALAFADVNLAPRPQLAELEQIGETFAGQGPALMTEYEPVGVRHFLRRLDAEGASELRAHLVPLQSGAPLDKLQYANLDRFRLDGILFYRTLVLRHSPTESRPPSPYTLRRRGRFYDVWQRPPRSGPLREHLSLGSGHQPGAVASCPAVRRLAGLGTLLAAVPRDDPALALPVPAEGLLFARRCRGGRATRSARRLDASAHRRHRRRPRRRRRRPGAEQPRPVRRAGPGRALARAAPIVLQTRHSLLRPGTSGEQYGVGPLVVSLARPPTAVTVVPSADASALCGRRLDWIEALA